MTDPVNNYEEYDSFKLAGVPSPGICTFPNAPERIEGWEQQVPSGSGGGFTVHKNSPPIEFDIEIYVWIGEDEFGAPVDGFAEYEKFKKLYKVPSKTNGQPTASSLQAASRAQALIARARNVAQDPAASQQDKLNAERDAQNAAQAASKVTAVTSKGLTFSHPLTDKLDPPVRTVVIGKWGMPKPDGVGGGTARIHVEEFRPFVAKPTIGIDGEYVEKKDENADVKAILHAGLQTLDAVRGPRT